MAFQRSTRALTLAIGAMFLLSCRDRDVDSVALVSASGEFDPEGGTLEVSVSPRNADGEFVGQDLPASAFSFANVTITSTRFGSIPTVVDAQVTDVVVQVPTDDRLTTVVVFDSSGSMSSNDPLAEGRRAGGRALFEAVRAGDRVAVLDFGAGRTVGLSDSRLLTDFTDDQQMLLAALDELEDSGGTPMYGSLGDALDLLDEELPDGGGTIVVLTDGEASDDALEAGVLLAAARQEVQVFPIGLGSSLSFDELRTLAQETGGGFIEAAAADELAQRFAGIITGVSTGRVVVSGLGMYDPLTNATGTYTVAGALRMSADSEDPLDTPFQFTVEID